MAVPLKQDGGIFVVPVEINGAITLEFGVDSGASDVSVPADVFSTLYRTHTIKDSDIIGERTYVLADGSKLRSVTFTIRSLKVGDKVVENVKGSVTPAQGTLLLGQSFLERFKSWSINNTNHELVLEPQ
jgi:clan AA aspartic protease (TIGR02281 family)